MNELEQKRQKLIDERNQLNPLEQKEATPINKDKLLQKRNEMLAERSQIEREMSEGNESFRTSARRQLGRTLKNTAIGVIGVPDLLATPVRGVVNMGLEKIGLPQLPSAQDALESGIDYVTSGYLKPRNKTEEYVDAINREVASLPFGGPIINRLGNVKALKQIPNVVQKLPIVGPWAKKGAEKLGRYAQGMYAQNATNYLGTAGGTAGGKFAVEELLRPDEDTSTFWKMLYGIGGGMAGGTLTGGAYTGTRKGLSYAKAHDMNILNPKDVASALASKISDFSPKKYMAQKEAGILPSWGTSTKNNIMLGLQDLYSKMPFTSKPIHDHIAQRNNSIKDKLGFTGVEFENIGQKRAPEMVREGAQKYHEKQSNEYQELKKGYEPLEKAAARDMGKHGLVDVADIRKENVETLYKNAENKAKLDIGKSPEGQAVADLKSYAHVEKPAIDINLLPQDVFESELKLFLKQHNLSNRDLATNTSAVIKKFGDWYNSGKMQNPHIDGVKNPASITQELTADIFDTPDKLGMTYKNYQAFMKKLGKSLESKEVLSSEKQFLSQLYRAALNKGDAYLRENAGKLGFGDNEINALIKSRKKWRNYLRDNISGKVENEKGELVFATVDNLGANPMVKKILKTDTDEAAMNILLSKDYRPLKVVKEGLGKERSKDLLQNIYAHVGLQDGSLNINKIVSWEANLPAKYKRELYGIYSPEALEGHKKLMSILKENKQLMKSVANTSGTAPAAETLKLTKDVAKTVASIIIPGASGAVLSPSAAIGGLVGIALHYGGAYKFSKLMVDQEFLKRLNRVSTARNPRALKNHIELLKKTPRFKRIIANSGAAGMIQGLKEEEREKPLITIPIGRR